MPTSNIPKVSVVVVTYNQETTIARTLDSILAQQCDFPFEIQIGDDCSTDSTSEICQRYAAEHPNIIHLYRNKHNKGCRDNYFDTLLRCNTPYIADCAGDDYWTDPLKLQKQADILDADPEITLVHTDWEYEDSTTGAITPSPHHASYAHHDVAKCQPGEMFLSALRHCEKPLIHLCSAMFRKSIFEEEYAADKNLFRNKAFPCEDLQLKAIYTQNATIAYLPEVTLRYSVGHESLSSSRYYTKTFDFYHGSLLLTLYLANKYNVSASQMMQTYSMLSSYIFAQAYFAHDRNRIKQLLATLASNNIALPWKSRILKLTLCSDPLWALCAKIKFCISNIRNKRKHRFQRVS